MVRGAAAQCPAELSPPAAALSASLDAQHAEAERHRLAGIGSHAPALIVQGKHRGRSSCLQGAIWLARDTGKLYPAFKGLFCSRICLAWSAVIILLAGSDGDLVPVALVIHNIARLVEGHADAVLREGNAVDQPDEGYRNFLAPGRCMAS